MGTTKTDNGLSAADTIGIETTMMAIREYVMGYYKGTCIEKVTGDNNISLRSPYMLEREPHAYQRQITKQKDIQYLQIADVLIATLQRMPLILTLHNTALHRSPELREIRLATLKFMHRYLRGVRIIEKGSKRMGNKDDSKLVIQMSQPRERTNVYDIDTLRELLVTDERSVNIGPDMQFVDIGDWILHE